MPHYKLTYFPLKGRAEQVRFIFAQAGVDFEDETVAVDEWAQRKADFPMGQLPVLEVDGKVLCQSSAIMRYLANEFGLNGKTSWERAQADMLVDGIADNVEKATPFTMTKFVIPMVTKQPADEQKVKALEEEFRNGPLKTFLETYTKLLKANGTGWFVGSQVTWADLAIAAYIERLTLVLEEEKFLDHYPELKQHKEKVFALPNISAWTKKRPNYIY